MQCISTMPPMPLLMVVDRNRLAVATALAGHRVPPTVLAPGFLPLYSLSNNTNNSKCLTTNNYQVEAPLPTNVPSPARSKACHHGLHAACHFVRVLPSLHVKQPKLQKHRPHKHMCKGPRLQTRQRPSQRRTNQTSPKVHLPPQLHQNAKSFYCPAQAASSNALATSQPLTCHRHTPGQMYL